MSATSGETAPGLWSRYRRLSLGTHILVWMILGAVAGAIFGERAEVVAPLGELFIRLLLLAAVPLVFFNLLSGLTSLSDVRTVGRVGVRILTFYFSTMIVALILGLLSMHAFQPGVGMTLREEHSGPVGEVPRVIDVLMDMVPQNIFRAFVDAKVAQLVVFALLLGVAALMLPAERRQQLHRMFDTISVLLRQVVEIILRVGPLGIAALAAVTVGKYGASLFGPLSFFIAGVWSAQVALAGFYLLLLYAFTRWRPLDFLRLSGPVYATTTATCSTLASIVVAMDIAAKRFRVPESVYAFTMPLGAQMNKGGTAIFLSSVLLFTAQAVGVEFTLSQQAMIVLVGLLLVEGSGGIPGGGLVVAFIFVKSFSLPIEIVAIIAGIYRLIDMGNTTFNCMGDLVGTVIVGHYEKPDPAAPAPARIG